MLLILVMPTFVVVSLCCFLISKQSHNTSLEFILTLSLLYHLPMHTALLGLRGVSASQEVPRNNEPIGAHLLLLCPPSPPTPGAEVSLQPDGQLRAIDAYEVQRK